MNLVFQTIFDNKKGNCWQAVWATILGLRLEDVPNFIEYENYNSVLDEFTIKHGYEYVGYLINPKRPDKQGEEFATFGTELPEKYSINGLFDAVVWSINLEGCCHAVVIDKNFNIVHDPNPNYARKKYPLADQIGHNGVIGVSLYAKINFPTTP